jgi:hypothetical protein
MSNLSLEEKIKRFPVHVMTRVTGWFVNKDAFNPGKVAEFDDRIYYDIDKATK